MRPDLTQTTTGRLNPSKLTGIGSTATSDETVFALTRHERDLLSASLGSTALRSRSIEELLEAVRAMAELSSEGSAEVHDRVDQARSMIESLPDPIGVTVVAQRLTIDGTRPAAETFISAPTGSVPARRERALDERPTRAASYGR